VLQSVVELGIGAQERRGIRHDTAASVTVHTQDDIRERQLSGLVDLSHTVPGLDVRAGAGGGVAFFQARSGSDEMDNQLLSDGVKSSGGQAVCTLSNLSTINNTLYGSDAMSSVLQLFTVSGQGKAPGRANENFCNSIAGRYC
jgi:outer membrane cobalamin receptor